MSVTPTARTCPVHAGLLRYAVHFAGWVVTTGRASYGSVVYASPHPSTWAGQRPRYWRHEARQGLRGLLPDTPTPPHR